MKLTLWNQNHSKTRAGQNKKQNHRQITLMNIDENFPNKILALDSKTHLKDYTQLLN
jgi:hypothetical protein